MTSAELIFCAWQAINQGPTRVLCRPLPKLEIFYDTPDNARRQHHQEWDIILIRHDAWTVGASRHDMHHALNLWLGDWEAAIDVRRSIKNEYPHIQRLIRNSQ